MCFFPIQQWPCHDNIVADKGLNLFDECTAECVYLYPQEEQCTSSFWGDSKKCTPSKFTDRQRTPTKIFKKWCCCQIKNLSGTRDTIRYLKTFRVISNEMLVLLLILCWCYFSCLQMYSEKFFNAYLYEQMFFEIFVAKGDAIQFFWEIYLEQLNLH